MKILESGKLWPIGVALAITAVAGMCVWTVKVTSRADIQESDAYMSSYQHVDAEANDFINAKIAFNKKYRLKYLTKKINEKGVDIKYALTTVDGKPVDNAKMVLAISRPETGEYDKKLTNPIVTNGVYIFKNVTFPKTGVWNLLLKVTVGDTFRFYELKADTRGIRLKGVKQATVY